MRMFGQHDALVAAQHLLAIDGIDEIATAAEVDYWHFLFDRHQIVWANGGESDTLYPGPQALNSVGPVALDEIYAILSALRDRVNEAPPALAL